MQLFDLDLSGFEPVNHLWPQMVERLGSDTSSRAVRQALDLFGMRGSPGLMPALLVETCGVALLDRQQLRRVTGLPVACLLYTSPSPRDATLSRMPSSA